jgi:hypothetical protein
MCSFENQNTPVMLRNEASLQNIIRMRCFVPQHDRSLNRCPTQSLVPYFEIKHHQAHAQYHGIGIDDGRRFQHEPINKP